MAMILVWWVVSARKWFKGPKVNVQHMMLGREVAGEDVLVGHEVAEAESQSGLEGKAAEAAKDAEYTEVR